MKTAWILRILLVAAALLVFGWVVHNTTWEEVVVQDPPKGEAAKDHWYALRSLLKGLGAPLETRGGLDPLPPPGSTLVLEPMAWGLFPDREARIKDWVAAGGHLVVSANQLRNTEQLHWIPMIAPLSKDKPATVAAQASSAASRAPMRLDEPEKCTHDLIETPQSVPAYEAGRRFHACPWVGRLRASARVAPSWELVRDDGMSFAMRVPFGRGSVTAVTSWPWGYLSNSELLTADMALVAVAVLDVRPGRPVWIVDDEAGEPLPSWLWKNARAPLLLALAVVALALWRVMPRFGPREAQAPAGRRSMGEQVRGTGAFVFAREPAALHAATRRAFDQVAAPRISDYARMNDHDRVLALAAALAPAVVLDQPLLLAALDPAPRKNSAHWLAAIETIEQARRALLGTRRALPS